jgi:hypothetical protein
VDVLDEVDGVKRSRTHKRYAGANLPWHLTTLLSRGYRNYGTI